MSCLTRAYDNTPQEEEDDPIAMDESGQEEEGDTAAGNFDSGDSSEKLEEDAQVARRI